MTATCAWLYLTPSSSSSVMIVLRRAEGRLAACSMMSFRTITSEQEAEISWRRRMSLKVVFVSWTSRPKKTDTIRDSICKRLWSPEIDSEESSRICNCLWSPEIDSEESISPSYVAWRASTKNRVVVPACQAGNRFLGSLTGLQIRAQANFLSLGLATSRLPALI